MEIILDALRYLYKTKCITVFNVRRTSPTLFGKNILITDHGRNMWVRYQGTTTQKSKNNSPYSRLFGCGIGKGLTPTEVKHVAYELTDVGSLRDLNPQQLNGVIEYIKSHSTYHLKKLTVRKK